MSTSPVFLEISPATIKTANRIFRHICANSESFIKFPRVNELAAVIVATGDNGAVAMIGIDRNRLTTGVIATDTADLAMVASVQDYAAAVTA